MTSTGPNHVTGSSGLVAVDKVGNRLLFLNPVTYQVVLTLDGFAPKVHELAISPDHRFAFAPIYGDGRHGDNPHPGHLIAKFDLHAKRHVADFSVSPHLAPHALRWGPHGSLYCICENSGVLLEMNPDNGTFLAEIKVDSTNAHRIEILPDGSKLYTENEEDPFCSVVDLTARRHIASIETPNGTAGIAISPDGRALVLTDGKDPKLLVVDTKVDRVIQTIDLKGLTRPAQIARFSPDGRYLVVTSHDEPKAIIFSGGLERQRLVELEKGPMDMGFHPDGSSVVIANQDAGTLSIVDLESASVMRTVDAGQGVEILSFY